MPAFPPLATWKTILARAFEGWQQDNVPRLGASLAYYTLFALAPVLLIGIVIAGAIFGEEAVQGEVATQLGSIVGPSGASAIQELLVKARIQGGSLLAAISGGVTLVLGATGAFLELEAALNDIWHVKAPESGGVWGFVKQRAVAFGLVLVVGLLLLASLMASAVLSAIAGAAPPVLAGPAILWQIANVLVAVLILTVLFAIVYKVLPAVDLEWRECLLGGLVTSLLFAVGRQLIALYLAHSSTASAFGAAGSLIAILVFFYYAAQVVLLGAEITKVIAALDDRTPQRERRSGAERRAATVAPGGAALPA